MRPRAARACRRAGRDAGKTLRRTRAYLAAALLARPPARDQAAVAWGLVAALAWTAFAGCRDGTATMLSGALVALAAAVSAIDARWGVIPDPLTGLVFASGIARALVLGGPETLVPALAGTAGVYGAGRALGWLHVAWRGRDGFGGGDVKLVAAAVPWLGLGGLPAMAMVAVGSAFVAIALMRLEGPVSRHDAIPFGPHLCLGLAWTAVLAPWSG